ncbi:MAG: hypothetical protein WCK57_12795, partial [Verrucomicrobiae bacterium]
RWNPIKPGVISAINLLWFCVFLILKFGCFRLSRIMFWRQSGAKILAIAALSDLMCWHFEIPWSAGGQQSVG